MIEKEEKMSRILAITLIILLPLFAQEFLEGVRAEDLELERIEEIPVEMKTKIENEGDTYWDGVILYSTYTKDSTLFAEVRFDKPGGKSTGVWLVDQKTKNEKQIVAGVVYNLKWSPDGKFLAYDKMVPCEKLYHGRETYRDGGRWMYSIKDNKERRIPFSDYYEWSPQMNLLAGNQYYGDSLKLVVYDAESSRTLVLDKTLFFEPWNFSWSPDGNMLAYVVATKASGHIQLSPIESEVFVINCDGSGKTKITHTPEPELQVKWLPDGKSIVVERFKETPDPATGDAPTEIVILKLKKKGKK